VLRLLLPLLGQATLGASLSLQQLLLLPPWLMHPCLLS
jgi:hypothetical protein